MMDPDFGFLEIGWFRFVNVDKLLRVAVCKREPGTLDLHHNAVAFSECMRHVGQVKANLLHLARRKGLRLLEAVAVFAAHDFAPYQHLVSTHRVQVVVGARQGVAEGIRTTSRFLFSIIT